MSVRDSEAIILRTYALGEGDRLVSFLSRSEGRVRGVARGARRLKSRFGSTLEPLSYVRIWFYERETRPLARISQCELLESFLEAQKPYNANVAFGLMAEITESVLPEREPSDPAFRLLLAACRAVQRTGLVALPIAYFALWTVRLGGWLPALDRCARCGRDMAGQAGWTAGEGSGIFCRECRPSAARRLSVEALGAARVMLRESLEALTGTAAARPESATLRELIDYALDSIEQHIEKKLNVRSMLELTQ